MSLYNSESRFCEAKRSRFLYVINSNGEKEPFSFRKVYSSARRSGASKELAQDIARIIKKEVYSGIKTSKIFKRIKGLLQKKSPKAALRFNLKEGMKKLGPTGFPFEKYVGEILKRLDYKVKINQHLPGRCIRSYEIDFIAKKGNLIYIGECKYRNLFGDRVHSSDALSNYARFLDILKGPHFKSKKYKNSVIKTMMVANTKFTGRALDYSHCMKVNLLGWRCPPNEGLEYLIEKEKLYPITILPSLQGRLKEIFVSEKMMLAKDILRINPQKFAKKFGISQKRLYPLIKETRVLLK